jgi:hypothetical protein
MAKAPVTTAAPLLVPFKLWPGERSSGRISIAPHSVAAVEEQGHHPPASRVTLRPGPSYIVMGSYDEVTAAFEKAGTASLERT